MTHRSEFDEELQDLREFCRNHPIHSHPYFKVIEDDAMQAEAVRVWAMQDYHVSKQFPCLAASIAAHIDDPKIRHNLVVNLWEEHGEGDFDLSHINLFTKLLSSIGISEASPPLPSTSEFIRGQIKLAEENVLSGLGAFCYGNELLSLWEFRPIEEACSRAFPNADLSYFKANREADGRHSRDAERTILSLCKQENDIDLVRRGAELALAARVAFYDGVLQQLN